MLRFSRDEHNARTGCGFGAFVSALTFHGFTVNDVRKFAGKVGRFNDHHLLSSSRSVTWINLNCTCTILSGTRASSYWARAGSDRPRGRAILQQEAQQPGSCRPRATSVERSPVMCEWSYGSAFTQLVFTHNSYARSEHFLLLLLSCQLQETNIHRWINNIYFSFNELSHSTFRCQK